MKNKRAGIFDLILWLAISFISILFFVFWIYGFNIITDTLATIDTPILGNENNSVANVSADVFGVINPIQTDSLHIIAFVLIFFAGLSIPITNFLQKSHPLFFIVFILIIIVSFMTAVYISNQYEDLQGNIVFGDTIAGFRGANFIMLNLPIWVTIIGVLGMIFLFSGILKDAGLGGGL